MESREQIYAFLVSLFGDDLGDNWLLVWTNPGKKSAWFRSVEDAAIYAEKQKNVNVYFGICLSPGDFGVTGRCPAAKVTAMPGLWADIDISDDTAHAKANLPKTLAEAKILIAALPLQPTVTVHTGHGLQCYWLFKEPWDIDNDVERAEAAAIARGWHETILIRAKEREWEVDATWDLARVFRLPGSSNVKDPVNPKPVVVIEEYDERRYNPDDFEQYFPSDISTYAVEMGKDNQMLNIKLTRRPSVDQGRLEMIWSIEPKAKATWLHRRTDLVDTSLSSYDMSLAAFAVQCGWTDQEIADLIVSFRIKHGTEKDIKKAFRLDYISRTIKNARIKFGRVEAEVEADKTMQIINERLRQEAVSANAQPEESPASKTDEIETSANEKKTEPKKVQAKPVSASLVDKKSLLESISAKLTVPVRKVIKYTCEPPVYALDTALGMVELGDINNLIRLGKLQTKIAEAVGEMIPSKIKNWDDVAQSMLRCVVHVNVGEDATVAGRIKEWILSYLEVEKITLDWEGAGKTQTPYRKDEKVFIFLPKLREFLNKRGDKVSAKELACDLKKYGCSPYVQWFMVDDLKTTRSVYELPDIGEEYRGRNTDNPLAE